jgi:hypothetical protein
MNQAERQRAYRERQKQARTVELEAKGLPSLPKIATLPGTTRWRALVEAARTQLETARDEMESYAAERSEAWQDSDKAEQHRAHIETIEAALGTLDELEL